MSAEAKDFLNCPDCDTQAVPATFYEPASNGPEPQWNDGEKAVCPGCGALVSVSVDEIDGEFIAQAVIREVSP